MNYHEVLFLVRGAKLKEPGMELALIEGFRPLILANIRKYVYDHEAVEDYLNEGALVILKCIETYQEDSGVPFAGYLKKELFYYFVAVAKSHQNLSSLDALLPNGNTTLMEVLADETCQIEGDYLHHEDLMALFDYLPLLRERQRWIIEEHYFKKQSFRCLGQSLGVTSNSLVKLHRRAIQDLRTHFGLHLVN
ncbi:MAG: sigma-70 family RNA polymerase sigma factor [Acetobacterium sp.]